MPHGLHQNDTSTTVLPAELGSPYNRAQLNPPYRHPSTQYAMELMGRSKILSQRSTSHDTPMLKPPRQLEDKSICHYGMQRIYEDRVILAPYSGCYCRYCTKRATLRQGNHKLQGAEHIEIALDYIRGDPRINTVIITGGDPTAKPERVLKLLEALAGITHLNRIRIGTRYILLQQEHITEELAESVASFNRIDIHQPLRSLNVSLSVSFNHVDELLPQTIAAVHRFTRRAVSVRGQTVLLKGINDNPEALKNLLDYYLAIGITPYYLLHCMDIIGTRHLRTSVQKGLDLLEQLQAYSGTYAMPYAYTTPVGKHRLLPGNALDYEDIDGERFIRAHSPYKADQFKAFSSHLSLPELHEVDNEGYIISRYRDGNDILFG